VYGNSFSSSTLVGYQAGYGLSTGSDNILLGWKAGYSVTTGTGNIIIGYNKDASSPDAKNELNIGGVLYGNLSAKTIGISTRAPQAALDIVSTGTLISQYAQVWRDSTGLVVASMTANGKLTTLQTLPGDNLGNHTATEVLKMGAYGVNTSSNITAARYQINGSTVLAVLPGAGSLGVGVGAGSVNSGSYNTFLGLDAGGSNTTAEGNSFFGYRTGYYTTGGYNSFFGRNVGFFNTTGGNNSLMGHWAAFYNTTGGYNSFLGSSAGFYNTSGENNALLGYKAGYTNNTGSANTILGTEAGYGVEFATSFSSSTLIGYRAGYGLTTGSRDNIFLGFKAGYAVTTGTGNIVLGYDKDTSAPGASNELNIGGVLYGDLSAKTIGVNTRVPQAALDIVSTGTASSIYAQFWRDGGGVVVATMNSTGNLAVPTLRIAGTAVFAGEYDNGNSGTAITLDWNKGNKQKLTLTGAAALTFSASPGAAASYVMKLVQDATGSRTITWPASVKWSGGTAPVLSTSPGAVDIIGLYYDGTNYYGMASINFI